MLYILAIKKLFENTQGGWEGRGRVWNWVKDIQEWDLLRSKFQNWRLCMEGKRWVGVRNLDFFVDVINEWPFANTFSLLNLIFWFCFSFSLSLYSLLFHSYFYCFCMLSKRDNQNFKKNCGRTNLKI